MYTAVNICMQSIIQNFPNKHYERIMLFALCLSMSQYPYVKKLQVKISIYLKYSIRFSNDRGKRGDVLTSTKRI